jgi:predicted ferric reductase
LPGGPGFPDDQGVTVEAIPAASARPARRSGGALALTALALANAAVVAGLWAQGGSVRELGPSATGITSLGRLAGLLGAYLALVQVLLLARLPSLERRVGHDRLTVWHRWCGRVCLGLLLAHAALVTTGYALVDGLSLPAELVRLVQSYPGVITAVAGLALLVGVVVSSVVIVRRRLRYETWYFVHLYAYLAIALAFSHQLATGRDFLDAPLARGYWTGLYLSTLGALLAFRLGLPLLRAARHRLRVERVVREAPGVTTLEIGGARLDRLGVRSGQFLSWRFLARGFWWEAHPYSVSAAPDGRRLRITVKALGDHSARLAALRPGTRVLAEGPYGAFTSAARRRERVVLVAGGVGITAIRALLEDMPGAPGDIAVIYRARHAAEVLFRRELDALARRRGADLHYVLGDHRDPGGGELLGPQRLLDLVPDLASRDVYVCGPPGMVRAAHASLLRAGVARRHIVTERFAL